MDFVSSTIIIIHERALNIELPILPIYFIIFHGQQRRDVLILLIVHIHIHLHNTSTSPPLFQLHIIIRHLSSLFIRPFLVSS